MADTSNKMKKKVLSTRLLRMMRPLLLCLSGALLLPTAQAALCTSLADLADSGGRRVSWPLRLPARSAVLLRGVDSTLPDADRDGIPDQHDRCAATPARQPVDAAGCAQGQR